MGIKRYEDLEVWKYSDLVMWKTYKIISLLPEYERYGLQSQMRRSSMSIPTNIVEGFAKRHAKEKIQYYRTSLGSAQELRYQLQSCKKLGYVRDISELIDNLESIALMLKSLIRKTPDLPTCL